MGFRQLSMTPAFVLPIKELIRSFDLKSCRSLAVEALKKETAWEVRGLLDAVEAAPPESHKPRGEKK
jgi:phosphoenolpyruvate-protein kinase (PTS system EI component)